MSSMHVSVCTVSILCTLLSEVYSILYDPDKWTHTIPSISTEYRYVPQTPAQTPASQANRLLRIQSQTWRKTKKSGSAC